MSYDSVSLSSRAVQRFFAGEISYAEFAAAHGWGEFNVADNPFFRAILEARMIKSVTVESREHEDDDWISFTFDDPTAAAGPFRTPKSPKP